MPIDSTTHDDRPPPPQPPQNTITRPSSFWTTPAPLKRLFDRSPLYAYPSNTLPIRASDQRNDLRRTHVLHIFGAAGQPSPNPTCLRYQTLLVLAGVPFETATSCNHASPSGSLPFLTTHQTDARTPPRTIGAAEIKRFIRQQNLSQGVQLDADPAHLALLEPIRRAYLAALYCNDETFRLVTAPIYVDTSSRSSVVRAAIVPALRAAAAEQVTDAGSEAPNTDVLTQLRHWWRGTDTLDEEALFAEATEAFAALSTILGESEWSGRSEQKEEIPGWLDASVFAYTHAILSLLGGAPGAEGGMKKRRPLSAERLHQAVAAHGNLVRHRERILAMYD